MRVATMSFSLLCVSFLLLVRIRNCCQSVVKLLSRRVTPTFNRLPRSVVQNPFISATIFNALLVNILNHVAISAQAAGEDGGRPIMGGRHRTPNNHKFGPAEIPESVSGFRFEGQMMPDAI